MAVTQVGSVYPPLSTPSITGQAVAGDGHLTGWSAAAQFSTVTTAVGFHVPVSGVGSAQSFGSVSLYKAIWIPVAGVGSAQQFGTARFNFRLPILGITSAQAFGTLQANRRFAVTGVASTATLGVVTIRTGFSKAVGSVPSAASFGVVRPANVVQVTGLDSAQAFGTAGRRIYLDGVPSAQAFGDATVGMVARNVWIWPTDLVLSIRDAPLCGQVICGDGSVVGGWEYLPAAGTPDTVVLDPSDVETLELVPTVSK